MNEEAKLKAQSLRPDLIRRKYIYPPGRFEFRWENTTSVPKELHGTIVTEAQWITGFQDILDKAESPDNALRKALEWILDETDNPETGGRGLQDALTNAREVLQSYS